MVYLLRQAVAYRIMPDYADRLLAACGAEHESDADESMSPGTHVLIEPLTQRELDVLHLLTSDLSVPEIADALVIAPSTARTHIKRIYGKLNVTNRRTAVTRATELHLL
jgi:LuxR family maltose regulon positive regulatory protein